MRKLISLLPLLALAWMATAEAHGPSRQKISVEVVINAPADKVWETVKDLCSIEKWHPDVTGCVHEGGYEKGATRKLTLANGGWIVDELKKYDPKKHMYKYRIEEMSTAKTIVWASREQQVPVLPVANYSAVIEVKPMEDNGTKVVWKGAFYRAYMNNNPPEEMNEEAAIKAATEFHRRGLENLKKLVEQSQ